MEDNLLNYLSPLKCILLFRYSVMSDSLWPHRLQHARPPCPSPSPRACSSLYPLSRWCHTTISSSVIPFSSFLQSLPASGSFLVSWHFALGGQSIGTSVSASVSPMNIQDWFPLRLTSLISSPRDSQKSSLTPQFEMYVSLMKKIIARDLF